MDATLVRTNIDMFAQQIASGAPETKRKDLYLPNVRITDPNDKVKNWLFASYQYFSKSKRSKFTPYI